MSLLGTSWQLTYENVATKQLVSDDFTAAEVFNGKAQESETYSFIKSKTSYDSVFQQQSFWEV